MPSTARKEAWSSRVTITFGTVTCLLPKLLGAVSLWSLCSSQRMFTQHILLCRLIGLYEVCGKVTGWRKLTIGSLKPAHPVTGLKTCQRKPLPDDQRVRKSASTLWSLRSSGDQSLPWCAALFALSMFSTQLTF